jgi:hypothetical protein
MAVLMERLDLLVFKVHKVLLDLLEQIQLSLDLLGLLALLDLKVLQDLLVQTQLSLDLLD